MIRRYLAFACVLLAATAVCLAERLLLTGDAESVWMVRSQDSYIDVLVRQSGGQWQWVARNQGPAAPAGWAAYEGKLYLVTQLGNFLTYVPDRPEAYDGDSLRTGTLALCVGENIGDAQGRSVVAIVRQDRADRRTGPTTGDTSSAPATTQAGAVPTSVNVPPIHFAAPDTKPASAPTAKTPLPLSAPITTGPSAASLPVIVPPAAEVEPNTQPSPVGSAAPTASTLPTSRIAASQPRPGARAWQELDLVLYQHFGGKWRNVAALQDVRLTSQARVFCAAADGAVYVLVANSARNELYRWRLNEWQRIDLTETLATADVVSVFAAGGEFWLAYATPADQPNKRGLSLAILRSPSKPFITSAVTVKGRPATWNQGELPQVAQSGSSVAALLWREGEALKYALCDRGGNVLSTEDVTILEHPADTGEGQKALNFFLLALLAAFIPAMMFKPRVAAKPFSLPEPVRPGNLLLRLVAGTIDMVIFSTVAGLFFNVEALSWQETMTLVQQGAMPLNIAYAFILSMVLYLAYCAAMEYRFGATLGKMLCRLRVVGDDGYSIQPREALLRNLVKVLQLSYPLLLPVLLFLPLITRYRQGLADMLARTTVADAATVGPTLRQRRQPPAPPPMPPEE